MSQRVATLTPKSTTYSFISQKHRWRRNPKKNVGGWCKYKKSRHKNFSFIINKILFSAQKSPFYSFIINSSRPATPLQSRLYKTTAQSECMGRFYGSILVYGRRMRTGSSRLLVFSTHVLRQERERRRN